MTSPKSTDRHVVRRASAAERRNANARIVATASRQLGLITGTQLASSGLGRGAVAHRRSVGSLIRIAPQVYAVGRLPDHRFARHLAAILSYGGGAWLSHRSAAAVWDLQPASSRDPVDMLVVASRPRARSGLRLHKTIRLDREDRVRRGALPVTSVARTVVDLSSVLSTDQLERVMADAMALHRCGPADIEAALARTPARSCHRAVRLILDQAGGARRTRSEAETRFLGLVRAAHLPVPHTNVAVLGYEADAVWTHERVIVEIDGFAFHGSRRSFERDRRRDTELQAAGWVVVRVTWRGITDDALATISRLATILAARARATDRA